MKNNQPLSEFATPAFRELIAAANPDVDGALSTSHHGVARYLMRLHDDIRPRVARDMLDPLSEIQISLDGCATKGGKHDFLGIVAHYIDKHGDLMEVPIALPQLAGFQWQGYG